MYASFWQFRRKPYAFNSGGPGSAIMKSIDGGKTWKKIHKGLPEGDLGRAALAIAPSDPKHIVMIVESKSTGLYLSEDGGENWISQGADDNVCARPFYFSTLAVDPVDKNRVYRPAFEFSYSEDGGHSWVRAQNSSGWVHSDMHALWINPKNTSHMYLGTDGGVYMSVDRGNNWIFLNNMPVSQLYHVAVDEQEPYWVYGGLQDNGSWCAPSRNAGGIKNGDWKNVGGGDGFWVQPDGEDHNIVYSEYQGGHVSRVDVKANQWQDIQPKAAEGDPKLRFNWNTPIVKSPNNKKRIYMASQFLYKTENRGLSWTRISPDLTTNNPLKLKQEESGGLTNDNTSAENHCTIFTIAESPLDENLIFAGTDDGNLQITTDGGKTWVNVADNYKACGVPAQTWISSIEPSRFDKQVLYVTFDNHTYGDMNTYCARSSDLGKTWTMFSSSVFKGFAHKIKEDLSSKDLLFLGTEMGLYTTIDGGVNWVQMKSQIPTYCLVRDIVIEPKTNDLVLGTHGRGVLIVDNISPLRQINDQLLNTNIAYIEGGPTPVTNGHLGGAWPDAGGFVGPNPTEQATIMYYLKNRVNNGDVTIEIYNVEGRMLVDLPGTKRKGINKVNWDMRIHPPRVAEGGAKADWASTVGPMVLDGTYKVKIVTPTGIAEGKLELVPDKMGSITKDERKQNAEIVERVFKMEEELAIVMDSVLAEQANVKEFTGVAPIVQEYFDSLENIRAYIVPVKTGRSVLFADEEKLRDKISDIYYGVNFYEGLPTTSQVEGLNKLQREINSTKQRLDKTKNAYRARVVEAIRKKKNSPY